MSTVSGRAYEHSVAEYFRLYFPNAEIIQNYKRVGVHSKRSRDIDILIRMETAASPLELSVECKKHTRALNVKDIEATLALMEDIKVQKGFIISRSGFSSAAIKRIENSSHDIELHLIDFSVIQAHETLIAMPFKGGVGALLLAPFGWYIESCPDWLRKLAALKPFDQKCEDFIYVNIWNHDEICSKEALNNFRKNTVTDKIDKNYLFDEWLEGELLFRRNKAFSRHNTAMDDAVEVSVYRDMPKYILELVLISKLDNLKKNTRSLKKLSEAAIPLKVDENMPSGRSLLLTAP